MTQILLIGVDLVAILTLTTLFFLRHRRRDLVVAYLTVNVGVLAVAGILGETGVGLGIGLGLFGVLSIIRLRSSEIAQHEVAYYFAALAMGLVAGLGGLAALADIGVSIALIALVLAVLVVADHPGVLARYEMQRVRLDGAYVDPVELTAALERVLRAQVMRVTVLDLDTVNDTTLVDVRLRRDRPGTARRGAAAPAAAEPAGAQPARATGSLESVR